MMTIHFLFNIYSIVYTVQSVVYYGYIYGYFDMTYWAIAMTIDSFAFASIFSYFVLNQFIAYLMRQFGNPDDKSQDMFFRFLMGQALRTSPKDIPLQEIVTQVFERMSLASEIRQS